MHCPNTVIDYKGAHPWHYQSVNGDGTTQSTNDGPRPRARRCSPAPAAGVAPPMIDLRLKLLCLRQRQRRAVDVIDTPDLDKLDGVPMRAALDPHVKILDLVQRHPDDVGFSAGPVAHNGKPPRASHCFIGHRASPFVTEVRWADIERDASG
jgi:hypothetical protein